MKELSIEEKAKAYDNIIEKANKMHSENCEACQICIEELIPELKESEDERIRKELISLVTWSTSYSASGVTKEDADNLIAWLEKQGDNRLMKALQEANKKIGELVEENYYLKEQGKQKPAWSEEDEIMINGITIDIKELIEQNAYDVTQLRKEIDWLKSLKDRVQPKQEWSEEDERLMKNLKSTLANLSARKLIERETEEKYVSWLKSLRPQNRWKPSDEQLDALEDAIADAVSSIQKNVLNSLYSDLKKLKG